MASSPKLLLGVESSCDDTSFAFVTSDKQVLYQKTLDQNEDHAQHGGVVPEIAAQLHTDRIVQLLQEAVSHELFADVDGIAVTQGPWLIGSLQAGLLGAQIIALQHNKPLIPVHHLIGHWQSVFLWNHTAVTIPRAAKELVLIVSGGHTDLLIVENETQWTHLGSTRDDAAGEAFDKTALMLGLWYPWGKKLSEHAAQYRALHGNPEPIGATDHGTGYDFSFSGFKTFVRQKLTLTPPNDETERDKYCAQIENYIVESLTKRVKKACKDFPDIQSVWLVGGVSANKQLRQAILSSLSYQTLWAPNDLQFCTDNAAMIAAAWFLCWDERLTDTQSIATLMPKPNWTL